MGLYFGLKARNRALNYFYFCPLQRKPRPSRVSLEFLGLENITQVDGNRPKIGRNHAARKAVLATFSVFKWSGSLFRPRSSKSSVQIFFLFSFYRKPRQSRVSLESPGLKNTPQLARNRAKVGQNHVARKAVSGTFSVLKWSGLYFVLEAWNRAFN